MIRRTLAALATLPVLAGGCTPTPGPVTTPDPGAVAILVLDSFTATKPPATADPKVNCFRTAFGANEVGSGGGGDGLPPGVSHGQAVYEVARAELNQPHRRLAHDAAPPRIGPRPLLQPTFVDSWHRGGQQVVLAGVDTADFNTGLMATELVRIMDQLRGDLGITRFVVNLSFVVLPCDVRAWFDAQPPTPGGPALTPARLLGAYRAIVDAVPELARLSAELDRLERDSATVDTVLAEPALAEAAPLLPVNLFYSLLADNPLDDILKSPNVSPLTRAAYRQVADDPLKRLFDAPPDGYRVVAVGAAGNGIFRRSTATGRGERVQFAFPFVPALWDSVVSVSASGTKPSERAAYSNSGEVMMDASNPYHASGTSFAAPRLSAVQALYLLDGGPVRCDGSVPPLGYARVGGSDAGGDVTRWDNLALSAEVAPGDPALRHCREFAGRLAPRSPAATT